MTDMLEDEIDELEEALAIDDTVPDDATTAERLKAVEYRLDALERVYDARERAEALGMLEPETGDFEDDVIDTGDRSAGVTDLKEIVATVDREYADGAPIPVVIERAVRKMAIPPEVAQDELDKLREKGEVYEPRPDRLRVT